MASATIDELGLVGDRRFMVVDEEDRFLTQRVLPQMALIATAFDRDDLILSRAGKSELRVSRLSEPHAPLRSVTVWRSEGLLAEDCGPEAAAWLGESLGLKCRLVRAGAAFRRPMNKPGRARADEAVTFADAYPFLVVGEASLADLNERLRRRKEPPVPMDRFRPNLVIAGSGAFAEDEWTAFRVGSVVFRTAGKCVRCAITTTDQLTGARGKEPLRTLATYRRSPDAPTDVNFGQNLIHETKSGALRVGDVVQTASYPII